MLEALGSDFFLQAQTEYLRIKNGLELFGNGHVGRHRLWPKIVVIGGGSGPVSIEDGLLNLTPSVVGVTGTHDSGGHSKEIRTILGTCAPGDITHRLAIHFRDPRMRQLFMHRWMFDKDHYLYQHRPSNEFFAAATVQEGSASEATRLLENMFNPKYYKGRVMPATDDIIDIRALCDDGSAIEYEDVIGQRGTNKPAIVDIEFIPNPPKPNPEVVMAILEADAVIAAGTSYQTSLRPIMKIPGIAEAIRTTPAKFIWICNAFTNFSETDGFKASDFAQGLCEMTGRTIDIGLLNEPNHHIPPTYKEEGSLPVEADANKCQAFVKVIYRGSFTQELEINGKPTVRHDGSLTGNVLVKAIQIENGILSRRTLKRLGLNPAS